MPSALDIATTQIGYVEQANNDNKYGKWYGLNNEPWCAMFVSWCFVKAGLGGLITAQSGKGFSSCDRALKWFTLLDRLVPVGRAQKGDIAFFQFDKDTQPDHIGIVASNNKKLKHLTCIEGNTSAGVLGSQANGDGVYKRKRKYALVMAVARP